MSLLKNYKIFFLLSFFGIVIWYSFSYLFSEPVKVINIEPEFVGLSNELKHLINKDFNGLNNKVIQIEGIISKIYEDGILLDENIFCQFDEDINLTSKAVNKEITIKGKVVGFDELLMELKLNQCSIIQ